MARRVKPAVLRRSAGPVFGNVPRRRSTASVQVRVGAGQTSRTCSSVRWHGRAGCSGCSCSLGSTTPLPAAVRVATRSEWDTRLVVRPSAEHRLAEGVHGLDGERRPLSRSADRRSSRRDSLSAPTAGHRRLRGHLRIGPAQGETDRLAPRSRETLTVLRWHLRRRRRVWVSGGGTRSRILGDRACLLRLTSDAPHGCAGATRTRASRTARASLRRQRGRSAERASSHSRSSLRARARLRTPSCAKRGQCPQPHADMPMRATQPLASWRRVGRRPRRHARDVRKWHIGPSARAARLFSVTRWASLRKLRRLLLVGGVRVPALRCSAGDCVDTGSPERAGHCCIFGSCVGSAYMGGQP